MLDFVVLDEALSSVIVSQSLVAFRRQYDFLDC